MSSRSRSRPRAGETLRSAPADARPATRLVSYEEAGAWRAAAALDGVLVDLERAAAAAGVLAGGGWGSVRQALSQPADSLASVLRASAEHRTELGRPRSAARLGPPVPDPDKVLCIGVNYLEHQREGAGKAQASRDPPRYPIVFNKFTAALIGDGDAIDPPAATRQLDYEAELAVVVGRRTRRVPLAQALDHVAGYTCFNDVTARDLQLRSPQWAMGKAFDTSRPMGPELVLRDEIKDPQALRLRGILNDEVVQDASTGDMLFSVAQLIEYISSAITLLPGDVIATGTPAGVGFAREPQRLLRPGDVFTVDIEGIGRLTNGVIEPSSPMVSELEQR